MDRRFNKVKKAKVWYLYHSGVAVQTCRHFLIFDYWRDTPKGKGTESGVIDPAALRESDVVVFVSHSHGDHFNREIFKWRKDMPRLRFILSDDIAPAEDAILMGPNDTLAQPDLTVHTLLSNDQGVAFVVEVDDLRIYHVGDLNWWHWEGEPEDENDKMAADYKAQIALLTGKPLDLAFVPVDPRLEEQYAWGIDHLMRTVEVRHVVPIHFSGDPAVVQRLMRAPISEGYRNKIIGLVKRGEAAEI
jgi:L-ascorbate metabolism protein UlaG (beta-lactamase superfamily)